MRFTLASTLVVSLAAQATANSWFGKTVYDKWHETELERWLSDHGIPHPSPSDRKNLQKTVQDNWNDKIITPYNSWDAQSLSNYLTAKGQQAKKGTEKDAKSLAEQVKVYWTETEDSANQAYGSVKEWIFDSWSDSQLKAFADKNGIPVPQPRQRDSLIKAAAADKIGETAAYPGDWLYSSWPSTRDSLIASIRRQSRLASQNAQGTYAQASSSAAAAQQSLSDALLDSWSDSQIKQWADSNGIKVPQGSKRNELLALARKHRARLYGDSASATVESAYGAATSQAGNQYNAATNGFAGATNWLKAQIGLASASAVSATDAAGSSASSASVRAASSASSASSLAAKSASSLTGAAGKAASSSSSSISKSLASASSVAAKSASSAASAASKSADKGYKEAAASASSASKKAKDEL
ncbi:hypothetical protein SNOG_08006 [Parastagonospora nodorum SN15]|uniref:Meiotic sister chromatid recombination protein 1 n=1 Tax=Phaeosphaeria nodorum (strain SN15 / ATCC MYA-4574 / FGSC 10173) TaxID=321614 RepID=Q0UJQ8_PHANO|nr:hypothetical protein SNOG_08006 [Parastagonospora nodorum SN15]EAT84282.2 hypothetical protein SNOG_08006 [Parastagonospora nodorum SN15]